MIVLRAPSANKQFLDIAKQLFADLPETNNVILVEPHLDKRLNYYKLIKSETDFRQFDEMDKLGLSRWLVSRAEQLGGSLSSRDANYLVERVGTNQQLLSNELEKLVLYSRSVDQSTIDLLTELTPQSKIFDLLDAAFAGNLDKTLKLYDEQKALKVEPQQIIALLVWQLHILALVKSAGERSVDEISREAGLNPFAVRKSLGVARNLEPASLKRLINNLIVIDVRLKSESLDADEVLKNYLINVKT